MEKAGFTHEGTSNLALLRQPTDEVHKVNRGEQGQITPGDSTWMLVGRQHVAQDRWKWKNIVSDFNSRRSNSH